MNCVFLHVQLPPLIVCLCECVCVHVIVRARAHAHAELKINRHPKYTNTLSNRAFKNCRLKNTFITWLHDLEIHRT